LPTSSEPLAIDCVDIVKAYSLGQQVSLRRSLAALMPGRSPEPGTFHALDRLSFTIDRGDFFGIVGHNGSGKSTLTQVISGITVPTEGHVKVWGLVLPLLEVGAGFHDELSGRENVFLLGTIIGLTGAQIRASLPRIVEFAGVERHIDTPLKRYSSGMRARLSFATAICFPADTYVFDEVLAVVDDDFRLQCIEELRRLNATGRTIIFMSHDLDLVVDTCRSGIWLERGRVRMAGSMAEVGRAYAEHTGMAQAGLAGGVTR
jgi:ABC-type polysaccharide/polyol phosphate transport system ATPase subunit